MRAGLLPALLLALAAGCTSSGRPGEGAVPAAPFLRAGPDDILDVGSVRLDRLNRSVIAEGRVNQAEGFIELLACGPRGKTHESILLLDVDPVDLNAAFLLLGLAPGAPPQASGTVPPSGHPVDLWIEWEAAGEPLRVRAEDVVRDRRSGKALPRSGWVYTGAVAASGQLLAANDQSLVATYWDPWALLNLPLPCGADDEALVVRTEALPPLGTPVTVRFHPAPVR